MARTCCKVAALEPEPPSLGQGGQLGAADSPPQVPAVVPLWPLPAAGG